MVFKSNLNKEWYKPGEVGNLLGVYSRSILYYKDKGLLDMRLDISTNRWYVSKNELIRFLDLKGVLYDDLDKDKNCKTSIVYARVSSHDQKRNGDLERQIKYITDYLCEKEIFTYTVYSDVSSGLNSNRSGLNKVINDVMYDSIDCVYVTYKDRLTRFGFEFLEKFFAYFDTKIIVIRTKENISDNEELVNDMMSLLASFSGKLYGMRSGKRKNKVDTKSILDYEEIEF